MRNHRLSCLLLVICGGLTLTGVSQKKPNARMQEASPEQSKMVARRVFEELYTQTRYEEVNQVFAPGCPVHFGGRRVGMQQAVAEIKGLHTAAPDSSMAVEQVSANGNMVTVTWMARGTHTASGAGMKPTGRKFTMRGTSRFKIENGKIVEAWNEEYRPELFRQLGVSKGQAFMFFTGERILAALATFVPDRLQASLVDLL